MYELNFNEELGLLEATLSGFWTLETVIAFQKDMAGMVMKYSRRFPKFGMLSDARELSVMSADASKAFSEGSHDFARLHHGRVAIVLETSLNKMQARRATADQEPSFFADIGDARQWLLNR
jgi:hypothetical protein